MKTFLFALLLSAWAVAGPFFAGQNESGIWSRATAGAGDVTGPGLAVTDEAPVCWEGTGGTDIDECTAHTGSEAMCTTAGGLPGTQAGVSCTELGRLNGVGSALCGISDTCTLTNKTIDADLNTISNLAHGAEVDDPSSGVHGVTGDVVGTTDTQTLTNKTISAASNTLTGVTTPSSTDTFTNKTFDANGTGNSISNIESADIVNGTLTNDDVNASAAIAQSKVSFSGFKECATVQMIEGANEIIWNPRAFTYGYTVVQIHTYCSSGTIVAQLTNNAGTAMTGCTTSDISVSSTPATDTCTANNSIAAGELATLTTSSNSSAQNCSFTICTTRNE